MMQQLSFFSILLISVLYQQAYAQIGSLTLSPFQQIHQKIAKTEIGLEYCRPAIRGRTIFGDLVPYNELWRTGANKNTKFTFSKDVVLDGQTIQAGSYVLFTKPNIDAWDVYIYDEVDKYGIPDDWATNKIVAQTKVVPRATHRLFNSLTISLSDLTNDGFDIILAWGNTEITIPIELTTKEEMTRTISDVLDGPDAEDYYLAAQYAVDAGHDLEQALKWINTSIALAEKVTWWEHWVKAKCHLKLNQKTKAKEVAMSGMQMAKEVNTSYGQNEFKLILDALEN